MTLRQEDTQAHQVSHLGQVVRTVTPEFSIVGDWLVPSLMTWRLDSVSSLWSQGHTLLFCCHMSHCVTMLSSDTPPTPRTSAPHATPPFVTLGTECSAGTGDVSHSYCSCGHLGEAVLVSVLLKYQK